MTEKNWTGRYGYSFDEGSDDFYAFQITATYNNGSFEGTLYDEEFSGHTQDLVHVKGFIEGDLISFVTTYPYYFAYKDDGSIIVDKSVKGHNVTYEGYFNERTGSWNGQWEIIVSEKRTKQAPEDYKEYFIKGPWEMRLADGV